MFVVKALVQLLYFGRWRNDLWAWELLSRAVVVLYRAWIRWVVLSRAVVVLYVAGGAV